MSGSSRRRSRKPLGRSLGRWSRGLSGPRIAAGAGLVLYLLVGAAAYLSTQREGLLGIELGPCGDGLCVTWVMPTGNAWHRGARPGMRVRSVDGRIVRTVADLPPAPRRAELVAEDGRVVDAHVLPVMPEQTRIKIAFWVLGAVFAVFGSVVLLRRPDASPARWFGAFGLITAVALAVGPAATMSQYPWSLMLEFVASLGSATTLVLSTVALTGPTVSAPRTAIRVVALPLALLMVGYVYAVWLSPVFYEIVGTVGRLYFVATMVGALTVLILGAWRRGEGSTRESARLILFGCTIGTAPFALLTLVPEALGRPAVVPAHVSVLLLGCIPATLAYAILQHQLLGIRRLVHRGMVYAAATIGLLLLVAFGLPAVATLTGGETVTSYPASVLGGLVVLAVVVFYPLREGSRWLLDRFVYRSIVDSETLIDAMHHDLLHRGDPPAVADVIVTRLEEVLDLESVVLAMGDTPEEARIVAASGERADQIVADLYPRIRERIGARREEQVHESRWRADIVLLVDLVASGEPLGLLVLGPKRGGEVFVEEERRLVAAVAPVVAMALHETELLAELRDVNRRLIGAAEEERARIARDLHDGPLQKAILLGGVAGPGVEDSPSLAGELVGELRELCSRLRPAILDDLGLVASLDWLLEEAAQRFGLSPHLQLRNIDDDQRFPDGTELALFRITQEALNNAVKHGRARSIEVSLSREDHGIVLSIADDGVGFTPAGQASRGSGIPGMRERVRQLGGSIVISSSPRQGTTITVRVPQSANDPE